MHKQEFFKVYVDQFINELDNVVVKPHNLSGNILADMENSNVKVPINFDDVGIPGFKGERQEKICVREDINSNHTFTASYWRIRC